MKLFIALAIILGMVGGVGAACEDEGTCADLNDTALLIAPTIATHTMSLDIETGQLSIDGIPIEKLSHSEIRDALKGIAREMARSNDNSRMLRVYDNQTRYLIDGPEECNARLKMCSDGLDRVLEIIKGGKK